MWYLIVSTPDLCTLTYFVSAGLEGYRNFANLLPGIWDTIHFTSRDIGYCVQYFVAGMLDF